MLPFVTFLCPFPFILGCSSSTGMNIHGKVFQVFAGEDILQRNCRCNQVWFGFNFLVGSDEKVKMFEGLFGVLFVELV